MQRLRLLEAASTSSHCRLAKNASMYVMASFFTALPDRDSATHQ
jgi:hypothetical protein